MAHSSRSIGMIAPGYAGGLRIYGAGCDKGRRIERGSSPAEIEGYTGTLPTSQFSFPLALVCDWEREVMVLPHSIPQFLPLGVRLSTLQTLLQICQWTQAETTESGTLFALNKKSRDGARHFEDRLRKITTSQLKGIWIHGCLWKDPISSQEVEILVDVGEVVSNCMTGDEEKGLIAEVRRVGARDAQKEGWELEKQRRLKTLNFLKVEISFHPPTECPVMSLDCQSRDIRSRFKMDVHMLLNNAQLSHCLFLCVLSSIGLAHIGHPPLLMSPWTGFQHLFNNVDHGFQRIIVGLIGIFTLSLVRFINSPYRKLPPGPLRLPILGNLLSLVGRSQLSAFSEWRKTYGDLIYLSVPGQRMLVINSHKIAVDLLERRSSKYSDRPASIMAYKLLSAGLMMVMKPHNAVRTHRRAAHEALKKENSHRYYPMQTTEAVLLAAELIAMPTNWNSHFQRRAASLTMSMIYDHPPMAVEDTSTLSVEQIHLITNRILRGAKPGENLVDYMPRMMHIPRRFAKWRRDAEEHCMNDTKYFQNLVDDVKERMASGTIRSCFTTNLIENASRNGLSAEENAWLAGTMYIAGSETSANMLSWFVLAMALHPEAQKRAQEELDTVVGRSRAPTFADFDQLPYIQAIVQEVLRWRSPGLFGIPHATSEDDWYEGMFIPKGTICLPNVWLIHSDPELYGPDAASFNPARYLDDAGRLKPGLVAEHLSYGSGRRICVGQHVANNMLFINFAIILWALKIERNKDANGELIPLDADAYVEEGIAAHPSPFDCKVLPRFPEASSLLENEKELRGI
ncbi:hypothetical protein EVG20_g7697 [Dentipellis fragilis]|uniref:Cytochrome P450 n=1 Tax=Dentipellis fragilis TaxID=205917 RepID=A0A4Y9YCC8_9AGAM|nr:hypothetical protein EVG20_g7697 [Dentipellis fragilis]